MKKIKKKLKPINSKIINLFIQDFYKNSSKNCSEFFKNNE